MEIVEVKIYSFEELSEDAKDTARDWLRNGLEYPWWDESKGSIRAFVEHFGGQMLDWSLGERGRDYVKTDITPENFRGLKLKDFKPDYMPTGFCFDSNLWGTSHKEWKQTGDPAYAFQQAIEDALCAIARDVEWQSTDECLDETLKLNDYRFTEEGRVWK